MNRGKETFRCKSLSANIERLFCVKRQSYKMANGHCRYVACEDCYRGTVNERIVGAMKPIRVRYRKPYFNVSLERGKA